MNKLMLLIVCIPRYCCGGEDVIKAGSAGLQVCLLPDEPDADRYKIKSLNSMKGAFKTATLRDSALTAPYFHNGSAASLENVVGHYVEGGVDKNNVSPNMKALDIAAKEQEAQVEFMRASTSQKQVFMLSNLQ